MSEVRHRGRVVEVRPGQDGSPGILVLRVGISPVEVTVPLEGDPGVRPGQFVWVYDDGEIEAHAPEDLIPPVLPAA